MICPNCHTEFVGNFCPSCGQSAKTQRFTVKNVLMSTLEVWGMGNRSLPRTLFHLFTRPGYMIGEYLDGKRMPFFPPVKMLFVLCIFFALATTLVDGYSIEDTVKKEVAKEMKEKIKEQATVVADSTARNDSTAKADSSKIVLSGQPAEAKREVENKATEKMEEDNDNPSKEVLFTVNGNKIKVEDFIDGVKGWNFFN